MVISYLVNLVGNLSLLGTSTRELGHNTPCSSYHSFIDSWLSIGQPGHLPEVIANTDQLPYQPHLFQTPVPESPESEDILYLPEDVLNQARPVSHPFFPVYS